MPQTIKTPVKTVLDENSKQGIAKKNYKVGS